MVASCVGALVSVVPVLAHRHGALCFRPSFSRPRPFGNSALSLAPAEQLPLGFRQKVSCQREFVGRQSAEDGLNIAIWNNEPGWQTTRLRISNRAVVIVAVPAHS